MSREVYLEGYQLGRTYASKSKAIIVLAEAVDALGVLAGQKLASFRENPQNVVNHTFAKTNSFGEGFFDGFVDRAEEIRG